MPHPGATRDPGTTPRSAAIDTRRTCGGGPSENHVRDAPQLPSFLRFFQPVPQPAGRMTFARRNWKLTPTTRVNRITERLAR